MKKIYLGALALATLSTATAQRINHQTFAPAGKHTITNEAPVKTSVNQLKGLQLWSDDFSTGANWSFSNTSTPAHGWVITNNVTATNLVAALSPFGAASAANGYAFVNSDAAGTGSTTNADIRWNGTPIDLTGYENVTLKFSNATRNWSSTYKVIVSTDGTNWTEFLVNEHITTNTNTTNPEIVNLNISSVAGNQATVWVGFRFEASWGWFWAVDDVEIIETDDFDIKLTNINWGSEGAWGDRLAYHQIPTSQVAPILFGGTAENIGRYAQNNASFNVTGDFTGSGLYTPIEAGQSGLVDAVGSYTPAATVGAHSFNFSLSAINTAIALTTPGTGYTTSTYAVTGGTGTGMLVDIVANPITVLDDNSLVGGSNYVDATLVSVTGGTGTGLIVDITAEEIGAVLANTITTAGTSYADATGIATLNGSGTGLTVDVVTVAGEVVDVIVANAGTGYQVNDVITIDAGDANATFTVTDVTVGEVLTVAVNNPGSGYVVGDVVTIDAGDANATIEVLAVSAGEILEVLLNDEGTGYTDADVVTVEGGIGGEVTVTIGDLDSDLTNNTLPSLTINTTQHLYSRTNATATAGSFNAGEGFEVGPIFDVYQDATLYAAKVYIASTANVGAQVFASVYRIDPNSGDFLFERTSAPVTITATETYVNIPLLSPVSLVAGEPILVVAGSLGDGGATNDLVVGTSGPAPEQTVFYLDYTDQTWYFTTSTPMVTLDFNQVSSVQEIATEMTLGQNMPNPFTNTSVINYTLTSTEDITFEIVDMTGKVVKVIREGVRTAGSYAITINANELSEGVYFYSMTNGTTKITKSMVVTK
jgi:hypothetical protein